MRVGQLLGQDGQLAETPACALLETSSMAGADEADEEPATENRDYCRCRTMGALWRLML